MAAIIGVQPDQRRSLTNLFFHTDRAKKGMDIIIARKRKVLTRVSKSDVRLISTFPILF
jgi:hypothetical protein